MDASLLDGNSSITQDSWDQNQVAGNIGVAETMALQQLLSSDAIPSSFGPGEVVYVMMGDVTYQVAGPSKPGGEVTISPLNPGISLEDLAAISAEQESIKPEFAYQMPVINSTTTESADAQNEIAQQIIQASAGNVFASNDGMQVIVMSGEDPQKSTAMNTIKLDGQNFVLQPGQQLPPEIQEMMSKGLPVDLSNYEFVIEGEPSQQPTQNYILQQNSDEVGVVNSLKGAHAVAGNMAVAESQPKNGIYVQVITACPGEFDDGEFAYLTPDVPEIPPSDEKRVIPHTPYMNAYLEFVKTGAKLELPSGRSNKHVEGKPGSSAGRASLMGSQNFNRPLKRKRTLDSDGEVDEKMLKNSDFDDPPWKIGSMKSDDTRPSGRGRGKGRGRSTSFGAPPPRSAVPATQHDVTKLRALNSEAQFDFPVSYIMQNEPHNFLKGDFVVDKKDAYKSEFPIWRIENGKLLQKFDPFFEAQTLYHKSASVYSSWSGDIRTNFKPVLADIVSASSAPAGRKQHIVVRVHDKYIPKPADDSLEQNALMQFFNIYVHALLNQAFSPTYLASIQQQNVEYLLEPIAQIDQLIIEAKQAACSGLDWNPEFQVALEKWSCYTFVPLKAGEAAQSCQAIRNGSIASRAVKFHGQSYDRDSLVAIQDLQILNSQDFAVGKFAFESLGIYHALHHFKYLLFKKCSEEAHYQISASMNKANDDIPNVCAQNRIWVQQMFRDLKGLLDRYIIIKTEEDSGDALPVTSEHGVMHMAV